MTTSDWGLPEAFRELEGSAAGEYALITMDELGIRIDSRRPTEFTCPIVIHSACPTEVLYDVGHTPIEEQSTRPAAPADMLLGVVAWVQAASCGTVVEKVGTRGVRIVTSRVKGTFANETLRASWGVLHLPWGLSWQTVEYQNYSDQG